MPIRSLPLLPWCAAGFATGGYAMTCSPVIPHPAAGLLLLALIVFVNCRYRVLLPLLFFAAGGFWMAWYAADVQARALPEEYIGSDVSIIGYATDLPGTGSHSRRYTFRVLQTVAGPKFLDGGLIRLSDYRSDVPGLIPGEAWQLVVRLKPANGFANPAGFDYERWLFSQRIASTGYIRNSHANHRMPERDPVLPVTAIRMHTADRIRQAVGSVPFVGLVTALAIGERRGIDPSQWEILRQTGTAHLMAISGLHVGLVAWLAFWLGGRIWSLWPGLVMTVPARKAAMLLSLFVAVLYSLLAGFTLPTQRALIMLAVGVLASLLDRRLRPRDLLSVTLLLVLLYDPLAMLSAGFWLSFGAVAMIFYGLQYRYPDGRIKHAVRLQWRLSLLLAPLTLLLFGQFSMVAPLANGVAIPVVAFLVVPVVLLGVCLLWLPGAGLVGGWLLKTAAAVLSGLWPLLEVLANVESRTDYLTPSTGIGALALLFVIVLLALPAGLHVRRLSLAGLLVMLVPHQLRLDEGDVDLLLMDVGQGLSALVQTREHALLFDTGARFSDAFNAGDAVILPVLQHRGIKYLDIVLISHGDNDHIGGAQAVLKDIEVGRLITNESISGYPAGGCAAGMEWDWDGVRFRILHPQAGAGEKGNNRSCVLQVISPYGSILLPADIEQQAERQLVQSYGARVRAETLIAPHHGSDSSSSPAFLDQVAPDLVLVPAGWYNRYRHPSREVVRRYEMRGIDWLTTGVCGAISMRLNENGRSVNSWRRQKQRIWRRHMTAADCSL